MLAAASSLLGSRRTQGGELDGHRGELAVQVVRRRSGEVPDGLEGRGAAYLSLQLALARDVPEHPDHVGRLAFAIHDARERQLVLPQARLAASHAHPDQLRASVEEHQLRLVSLGRLPGRWE